MSQVKFILLGTTAEPKRNYEFNGDNEYVRLRDSVVANNPGAIIFTTFVKSEGGKPKNEIYANGLVYSVGGGGSGSVYYGADPVDSGKIAEWDTSHPGEEPEKGSIYIYTPNSGNSGEDIANRTAYYFDCIEGQESKGNWVAFTGNVNAENVWFTLNFTLAGAYTLIGNLTKSANGMGTLLAEHKNLKLILETILTKELYPSSIVGPTYRFSTSVSAPNIVFGAYTSGSNIEVGTLMTLSKINSNLSSASESISVSGLTYGYKIENTLYTGNSYTRTASPTLSGSLALSINSSGFVTSSGESPSFTVASNEDGSVSIALNSNLYVTSGSNSITLTETGLTYSPLGFSEVTIYPVSNLHNTYLNSGATYSISTEQEAGDPSTPTNTRTFSITGYYPYFYGTIASKTDNFTSDLLKELTHSRTIASSITVPSGMQEIIVAVPYNGTTAPSTLFSTILNEKTSAGYTGSDSMGATNDIIVNFNGGISHKYRVLYAFTAGLPSNANTYNITYKN